MSLMSMLNTTCKSVEPMRNPQYKTLMDELGIEVGKIENRVVILLDRLEPYMRAYPDQVPQPFTLDDTLPPALILLRDCIKRIARVTDRIYNMTENLEV